MTPPTLLASRGLATHNSGKQQTKISFYMSDSLKPCNNSIVPVRSSPYTVSNPINIPLTTTTTSTKVQLNIKTFLTTTAKISTPPARPLQSSTAPPPIYKKHHKNIFPPSPLPGTYLQHYYPSTSLFHDDDTQSNNSLPSEDIPLPSLTKTATKQTKITHFFPAILPVPAQRSNNLVAPQHTHQSPMPHITPMAPSSKRGAL